MPFRSGFVAIAGRPNAGKSTLLNALAGEKLAIVSPRPQTTRNRILGVLHVAKQKARPGAQVILIDTPGVHRAESSLGRKMMREVGEALNGCDLVLMIVDAAKEKPGAEPFLLDLVKSTKTPVFLLLNKIDLLGGRKNQMLPVIESYSRLHEFRQVIPISARKREGLDLLLDQLIWALPEGPRYFPEDQITDQPSRFMAAELIREQVLVATSQEVPHSTTVLVEQFEETPKLTRIWATIYCERQGQKRILIGHQGHTLKKIGTAARIEIERMLETKVFLELFVKVRPNWRESRGFLEQLDWRRQLEYRIKGEAEDKATG
jgi:GTPase